MDRVWKVIERACGLLGVFIIAAATLYFTAGSYWGWNQQPKPSPSSGAVMSVSLPLWLYMLAAIGVLLLITAWVMILLRRNARPEIHGRMFPIEVGMYVGQITISIDKLSTDLFLEIGILGYNGTTKFVSFDSVRGSILYEAEKLPTPTILRDRGLPDALNAAKEFLIVLEKRVPRNVAEKLLTSLNAKKRVNLNLQTLDIMAFFPPDRERLCRLPLWHGSTIDCDERPRVGRIISGSMTARL